MNTPNDPSSAQDPVARRLARLRTMPVETASLDRRLRADLPPMAGSSGPRIVRWLTPLRALAASVVLIAAGAIALISVSPSPAVASPEQMAGIYAATVEGNDRTTPVRTIDDARIALQRLWPGTPEMPEVPEHRLMSCCVHRIGRQMLSCMTFEVDGEPVTLALAAAEDIRLPAPPERTPDGTAVLVSESAGVKMVMTERDGLWMCLMGKLPADRLREMAMAIRDSQRAR